MKATNPNMATTHSPLSIRRVRGMGRGVFAERSFQKGDVIEICPVLVLAPNVDVNTLGVLDAYVFKWGPNEDRLAIALGYGSLYNHSTHPNAEFRLRCRRDEIVFRAVREIAVGEQILIDYRWDDSDYAAFRTAATRAPGR